MTKPRWYEVFMWMIGLRICPYCDGLGFTWDGPSNSRYRKLCGRCGGFREGQ